MSDNTHHQYYKFGEGSEEWVAGSYALPWFWESPDTLPYSQNFHAPWETAFPSRQILPEDRLEYFKIHAEPITQAEYERLRKIKQDTQDADDKMEYMFDSNPWSYLDDD